MIEIEIYPGIFEEVKSIDFGKCEYYPKALLIMADEMTEVVEGDDYKLVNSIKESISSIARLGRASACHLALATQRPSGNVISSDLKNNIQQSVILGDFDTGASTLIFDEDISHKAKPYIKGRGFIKSGKEIIETQTYWTEPKRDFVYKEDINGKFTEPSEDELNLNEDKPYDLEEKNTKIDDFAGGEIEEKEDIVEGIPESIKNYNITIEDILGDEEEDSLKELSKAMESVSEGSVIKIKTLQKENEDEKNKEEIINPSLNKTFNIKISNEELLSEFSNIKINKQYINKDELEEGTDNQIIT